MPITLILRNPLDRDAREYAQRAGIASISTQRQLSDFVRGIKGLGLWSSMICWPLRSEQNSGGADATNTTVYSLGGHGTFDGTRVNGPTWGASGMGFIDGTRSVSLPLISAATAISASGGYSAFSVLNFQSRSSANSNFSQRLSSKLGGGQLYTDSGGEDLRAAEATTTGQRFTSQSLSTGSYVGAGFKTTWGVLRTDSTGFSIYDTAAQNTSVSTFSSPVPPPFEDGTAGSLMTLVGSPWTGNVTLAMVAFWAAPTTSAQAVAVRNLYKETLGTGLGLP